MGAGEPSGSIYRPISNIYAYSTMSTSAFIAWATSLCDSKKTGHKQWLLICCLLKHLQLGHDSELCLIARLFTCKALASSLDL